MNQEFENEAVKWLASNGIFTQPALDAILVNLKINFPIAKEVDFTINVNTKELDIFMYIPWYLYLFYSKDKLEHRASNLLNQFNPELTCTVRKKAVL